MIIFCIGSSGVLFRRSLALQNNTYSFAVIIMLYKVTSCQFLIRYNTPYQLIGQC